jgi:hypothetical protein
MRTPKPATADEAPSRQTRRPAREGLRPVRIWIPDLDARRFSAEAHRQSLAVAASEDARDDQNFLDAISDLESNEKNCETTRPAAPRA